MHKLYCPKILGFEYVDLDYLLKSRLYLLDKINMKPYFIFYDDWQANDQINFILDTKEIYIPKKEIFKKYKNTQNLSMTMCHK